MKHKKGYRVLNYLLIAALNLFPVIAMAQDPGDPGGDPDAPIDGGLLFLVVIGILYGIKRYYIWKKMVRKSGSSRRGDAQDSREKWILPARMA